MKRFFPIMGILGVLVLFLAGCSSESSPGHKVPLGQQFILPVGQTISIQGENLSITFDSVTNDSRCPTGVQCVWAGEAKCQIKINHNNTISNTVLTVSGGSEAIDQTLLGNYKTRFNLTPYPEAGKPINGSDYKLIMTVTQ